MKSYIRRHIQEENFNVQILNLLEQRGLLKENIGTELYAEVVANTVYFLSKIQKESEIEELREQLLNPFSEFYFDISRNDNDIGIKTFHTLIKDALPDSISAKEKNMSINKDNYKEVAFILGNTILASNRHELNMHSKTRKLIK